MRVIDIVRAHPDKKWSYSELAKNPSISYTDFLSLPKRSYKHFSENPNLTLDIIKANLDKKWDWGMIAMEGNITFQDIVNNPTLPWEITSFSSNPHITFQDIINNPQLEWNSYHVSRNPNITIDIVLSNLNYDWNWDMLSGNESISFRDILDNLQLRWNMKYILQKPGLTIEYAKKYIRKYKNISSTELFYISRNPGITFQDILDNPQIKWRWQGVALNPNVTFGDLLTNRDKCVNDLGNVFGDYVSDSPNITMDIVLANPDIEWNWLYLSRNPKITWTNVLNNINLPWDWKELSSKSLRRAEIANNIINDTLGMRQLRMPAEILANIFSNNYDTSAFSLYELIEIIRPVNKHFYYDDEETE